MPKMLNDKRNSTSNELDMQRPCFGVNLYNILSRHLFNHCSF